MLLVVLTVFYVPLEVRPTFGLPFNPSRIDLVRSSSLISNTSRIEYVGMSHGNNLIIRTQVNCLELNVNPSLLTFKV